MTDIHAINPYIRVAMHSVLAKDTEISKRIIFDYELIYIADGEFVLDYDGTDYEIKKGQFILLRPGISHSFSGINSDLSQPHFHFDMTYSSDSKSVPVCFKDIDALDNSEKNQIRNDIFVNYPKTPYVNFKNKEKALEIFYAIIDQQSELIRKGLLIILINMLITDNFPSLLEESYDLKYSIEAQVKDYLDAGQGFLSDLDDIARHFNYSKRHLERRFKKRYGISLISYRNGRRMQAAKNMLETENVSDVSIKAGFSSIYVFSRAFKNYFGISPSEFKKSLTY